MKQHGYEDGAGGYDFDADGDDDYGDGDGNADYGYGDGVTLVDGGSPDDTVAEESTWIYPPCVFFH